MVDTLFFVHPDAQDPDQIPQLHQLRGWNIAATGPHAPDALECMAEAGPVAAIFCLDGDFSGDVRTFAEAVLADERLGHSLMVFTGGTAQDIADARAIAPYGIFVRPDELPWVVKRLTIKM